MLNYLIIGIIGGGILWVLFKIFMRSDRSEALPKSVNKDEAEELCAPVSGAAVPVSEVKDEVFSSLALGNGVGIMPDDGLVYAPADCEVEMLAETKHAVGLRLSNGISVLIHIGIDTVKLGGRGFELHVGEGEKAGKDTLLCKFDKELLVNEGFDPTVVFIATELPESVSVEPMKGHVKAQEPVIRIRRGA